MTLGSATARRLIAPLLLVLVGCGGDDGGSPDPACGDGIVQDGEACDDGNANSDVAPDACRSTCTLPACGDGVVDAGEACDDGELNSDLGPSACRTTCVAHWCGDGICDYDEAPFCLDDCSSCGVHQPPAHLTRQTSFSLAGNSQLWASSNTEWPQDATLDLTTWNPMPEGQVTLAGTAKPTLGLFAQDPGDTAVIELQPGSYATLRIETDGLAGRAGSLQSEQPGANAAPVYLTISPCPGDPLPDDDRCRSAVSGVAGLGWSIGGDVPTYCPLQEGTTYWLSVFFLDPLAPETSTCGTPRCWWLVTQGCQQGC